METSHLKFLENFPYAQWAETLYLHYSFDGDMKKLVSLFFIPNRVAVGMIQRSLIKKFPNQPAWLLEMVARENLKELVKVVRKYEFQKAC